MGKPSLGSRSSCYPCSRASGGNSATGTRIASRTEPGREGSCSRCGSIHHQVVLDQIHFSSLTKIVVVQSGESSGAGSSSEGSSSSGGESSGSSSSSANESSGASSAQAGSGSGSDSSSSGSSSHSSSSNSGSGTGVGSGISFTDRGSDKSRSPNGEWEDEAGYKHRNRISMKIMMQVVENRYDHRNRIVNGTRIQ